MSIGGADRQMFYPFLGMGVAQSLGQIPLDSSTVDEDYSFSFLVPRPVLFARQPIWESTEPSSSLAFMPDEDFWSPLRTTVVSPTIFRIFGSIDEPTTSSSFVPDDDSWSPLHGFQVPTTPALQFTDSSELGFPFVPEEYIWRNLVSPVQVTLYQSLPLGDKDEIPAGSLVIVTYKPDEDLWRNLTSPVAPTMFVRLPMGDRDEIPAGSLFRIADATAADALAEARDANHTAAFGGIGVIALTSDWESGGKVTYSYKTDIHRMRAGYEYRESTMDYPRRTYEFTALLDDGPVRDIRSILYQNMAKAQQISILLPQEAIGMVGNTTLNTLTVGDTTKSEWVLPGRRCVVMAEDGTALTTVVQNSTGSTVTVDDNVGAAGKDRGVIAPLELVWLDTAQSFGSYPNNLERWDFKATSVLQDPALGVIGTGASAVTLFAAGPSGEALPVWDQPLGANDIVQNALDSKTESEDLGGLPAFGSVQKYSDVLRQINITIRSDTMRQWVKKFFHTCRGAQRPFYLATWRDDALLVAQTGPSTLRVQGPPTPGAGDVSQWFNDQTYSHRQLQILALDGTATYVEISAVGDNGDGTMNIVLVNPYVGPAIDMISFLERVRFESDDLTFEWHGAFAKVSLMARTVRI